MIRITVIRIMDFGDLTSPITGTQFPVMRITVIRIADLVDSVNGMSAIRLPVNRDSGILDYRGSIFQGGGHLE